MFEIKVLLRHPSALIPRTADNKGGSIVYDLLILMFNVLDDIDLENLDDLDEGGGVDDLVRLGPLHHNLGAGHQRLAVHRGQAKPGQGDGWSESLIRKIKCFTFFTGDLFHPVCGDKSIHVNPLLHGGLLCPSINHVWSLHKVKMTLKLCYLPDLTCL